MALRTQMKKLAQILMLFIASFALAQGPAKTTISDTVYAPNGELLNATLRITNSTFTSADGYPIPAGSITVKVVNGVLNVGLVPTAGATPSGQSYRVDYFLSVRTTETWLVPNTGPTNLAGVRALSPPVPTVMIAASQVTPPSPCTTNQVLTWNGSTWTCSTPSGGPGGSVPSGNGFTHITSGAQDSAAKAVDLSGADATGTIAAARMPALTGDLTSSAGSTSTTLPTVNSNVGTFTKLTVNGKGQVTAAANIVAGDVPNITESQVTGLTGDLAAKAPAARSIATSAPLTGGGDLSADRTLGVNDFVASGASHARGTVPDPGASAGSTRFLREDATWAAPPSGFANPMTTLGDLIIGGASGAGTRLAGDTSNTRKFLRSQSSGGVATSEVWDTLVSGDIPNNAANTSGNAATVTTNANLTGDVTSVGNATTLANIPTATPAAGSIVHTNIASPSSPSAGKVSTFSDSTDLRFHDKNASGVIGTTVVADAGASNNFLTGISAAGVITKAQPAFSNLSGNIATGQMNSGTGASSSTFFRGDGTWATPSSGSVSTNGAAVASPNLQNSDTAYNQLTATKYSAIGSGIIGRTAIVASNCLFWGDSITFGTGSTAAPGGSGGFANLLIQNECSGLSKNSGTSSDWGADLALKFYAAGASPFIFPNKYGLNRGITHFLMIGTNEAALKQTTGYQTGVYRPELYGVLAFASIPRSNALYAQDSGCTKTGTWSVDNSLLSGLGEKSNTNGDTISCANVATVAASPFVYVGYKAVDSNGGAFNIKVDGVTCTDTVTNSTTLNNAGTVTIATANGATSAPFIARCPASAGTHTILMTVSSATSGSNVVYIEWVGSMPNVLASASVLPRILQFGVLRQSADAQGTWTNNYNAEIDNIVATLASDTMPIQFVPDHDYTVATLPSSPVAGALADVNDGANAADCTTGSGSTMVRCRYSGSAWVAVNMPAPAAMSSAAGNYFDTVHPNDILHALIHDRAAAYLSASGGNVFTQIALQNPGVGTWGNTPTNFITVNANDNSFAFGATSTLGDYTGSISAHNINSENGFLLYDAAKAHNIGIWASKQLDNTSDAIICWSNSTTTWSGVDTCLNRGAAGETDFGTSAANALGTAKAAAFKSNSILDTNGNAFLSSSATASAVDGINITNAATANPATVTIAASGTDSNIDTALNAKGTGVVKASTFFTSASNTATLTADWTCGTGGTVSSCASASGTIIGSGGGVPLTFTLPLRGLPWHLSCSGVVGQATAATANSWNLLTATNGATNVTAWYQMNTAATAFAGGATTDQASTTTTFLVGPTWTLGGTATKMPFRIEAQIEGASASGTVLSLQVVAPTVGDLLTIYRGASCRIE
jgi:hypothetical protein